MSYFGPETMFMLSLQPQQREFFSDLIEDAGALRYQGMSDDEILDTLSEGISTVEGWTETPRIVRIIILGEHGS